MSRPPAYHRSRLVLAAPPPDPFGEHQPSALTAEMSLLGGRFLFESQSNALMRVVRAAYAGLPSHEFANPAARFVVRLVLGHRCRLTGAVAGRYREPPLVRPVGSGETLCGAMDSASFVAVTPRQREALIVVAPEMLRYPYHVRYELLEFAVYVLAARAQHLVPLHAACLGVNGSGLLVIGASGSGKSTLVTHALLAGMDFLAEDSVLVEPTGLRATGVANYVHLRRDSLHFLEQAERCDLLSKSQMIRRRSGAQKYEIDLRGRGFTLAARPLALRTLVFLSRRRAGPKSLLLPLPAEVASQRLLATQRYAAGQKSWESFYSNVSRLPSYELRRARHPQMAIEALQRLLHDAKAD